MAIPEAQLDTWSKQGSVAQSRQTYGTLKNALEASDAPYSGKSFSIFLQGSYGNDTNIYADSDVDIVILTDSVYYADTSELSETDMVVYNSNWTAAAYNYTDFKRDVVAQLTKKFGDAVKPGNKAIFVEGDHSRRDADVLPSAEYRRYSGRGRDYIDGICFWTTDGVQIVNYPKQHSTNCTSKHQNTNSWFKPTVRILKNMRNSMIDQGYLAEGVAPSYFLEGMLYNVPNLNFGRTYGDTVANALNWIINSERAKLVCANEQYYLVHPSSPVTWRAENMHTYLDAAVKFWKAW
jgi:hypothetical protein